MKMVLPRICFSLYFPISLISPYTCPQNPHLFFFHPLHFLHVLQIQSVLWNRFFRSTHMEKLYQHPVFPWAAFVLCVLYQELLMLLCWFNTTKASPVSTPLLWNYVVNLCCETMPNHGCPIQSKQATITYMYVHVHRMSDWVLILTSVAVI